jgi:VCBS repeat-containing protein
MMSVDGFRRVLAVAWVVVLLAWSFHGGRALGGGKANKPPTVTITSPADGAEFPSGAPIDFAGTATDREDGDLAGQLVWTSDVDGPIGAGGSFSTILSDGAHLITASVTDSGGKTGADTVSVTVVAPLSIDAVEIAEPADPGAVPRYAKVELLVTLSGGSATEFYDPDPASGGLDVRAELTGPDSTWQVNGFYDGASWRIRFAPDAVGAWSFSVAAADSGGEAAWTGGAFTCVASAHSGWPRIDGHTLRFTDGAVVFAVGHNTGWQYAEAGIEQPSFSEMAAKGENLLSFWLATPWAQPSWASETEPWWDERAPIENAEGGIGNYNQAACAYIDGVVARAEAARVCLLPTIWTHGQLRDAGHPWGEGWWDNNAYSGICTAADFFNTAATEPWRRQKNFYRYLIARWGYSRAIAGWVGLCEIDGTTGYRNNPSQAEAWCAAVRDYFRVNDPFRRDATGGTPIAFTKLNDPAWGDGDLRATDNYARQTNDVEVAAAIGGDTETMRASGKPCFHAEFGGDTINGASQPTHLHNGIWPGAAAGAAMTPLVWCDGGNFPMLTTEMRDHLRSLAQFMAGVDYLASSSLGPALLAIDELNCRGWGMSLPDRGFLWLQKTDGSLGGQTLTISGLANGDYALMWYDVWATGAAPLATDTISVADGTLTAMVPALVQADIACKFAPTADPPKNPPVAMGDSYVVDEDDTLTVAAAEGVLANDTDADLDPLSASLLDGPSDGSVSLNADGSFTYTPDPDFYGADSFTYKASDGSLDSCVATVAITVNGVNDPPVASDDSATTQEGTPVVVDVLANDTDPDGDPLTVAIADPPLSGTAVVNADNTVTYTPFTGFTGIDSFTYVANDGLADSNVAAVAVTVNPSATPSIYGWITVQGTGSPLAGIAVRLDKKGRGWQTVGQTTTDPEGYYEFNDLAAGDYKVIPSSSDWRFDPRQHEASIVGPGESHQCDFTAK